MTEENISRSWIWDDGSEAKEDAQAAVAKSLDNDPSFFEIDWAEWKLKPSALIVKILALSTGINPAHPCASMEWASGYSKYVSGAAAEKLKTFCERWPVVSNHLTKNGGNIEILKSGGAWRDSIRFLDFAKLARDAGWNLPEEFPCQNDTTNLPSAHDCKDNQESILCNAQPAVSAKTGIEPKSSTTPIPGKLPRSWIRKEAIKIAFMIEENTGVKADAKIVMENLRSQATHGGDQGRLKIEDQKLGVSWLTEDAKWVDWTPFACREALRTWNMSRK